MLGMAVWFPAGVAGIDNLVFPLLSFPLIWAILLFYAYLERRIAYVTTVFAILLVSHIALLTYHFMGTH
ncbi:hypothetical protein FKG94_08930 [Exilibacterium tricleocarpae]|uniref:Uncharacterized protein n=2 Tax=Exilibacterium tricleocarpae TaxID=2591008 RepID=A0A545TVY6_9GAMM|nr:hypothetical protein FKG94_08930 [Exilibacterium tricleocarpae]